MRLLPCHQTCFKLFEDHWKVLEAEGRVRNSFNADRHGLVDIITFCVTIVPYRRKSRRAQLSRSVNSTLDRLRNTIVQWIGGLLQRRCTANWHANHPAVNHPPPPPLTSRLRTRHYAIVDPLAVCAVAEKARQLKPQSNVVVVSALQSRPSASPSYTHTYINT